MNLRVVRLAVLVAAVVFSAASGGPASSGPAPGVQPGAGGSVEGQSFTGIDGSDRINFYFRAGGVLQYRDPQGWWEDGQWRQTGAQVTFWLSDGFASYSAYLSGDGMAGTATNKNGKSWKFSVQKGTPRQPGVVDLTGSTWGGKEDTTCIVFQFGAGGALAYDTPSGHFTDGTWEIDGDWVYFKHTGSGLEYFGNIKGDRMNGNLWSTKGQHWGWDVNKNVVPPACSGEVAGAGAGGGGDGGKPGFGSGGTPAPAATASIEGSTFEGDNGGDATALSFQAGGVLVAKDPQGEWKGSWFQNGTAITFDLNGRYSWYEGELAGATISGAGHNKDGLDWKFSVTRK